MSDNHEFTSHSPSDERLIRLFDETKTIAVIGASTNEHKPAHGVPLYMQRHGHRVLPVNPSASGQELFGEAVASALVELDHEVDLVNVFRRSEDVPGHLPDILAMRPLPKVVWLQLGIRNDAVAAVLRAAGIEVVQDRCIKVEHARLLSQASG